MAHRLRILHISDTLFSGPEDENQGPRLRTHILGEAWERNLDAIQADGPVDIVAFTGDVARSGQAQEYEVATEFVRGTLQRLRLPPERLFVVPGNHDINHLVSLEALKDVRVYPLQREAGAQELSRWMAGGPPLVGVEPSYRERILEREANYRQWMVDVCRRPASVSGRSGHPFLGYRETLQLHNWPFEVHVIGLDSVWLSGIERGLRLLRLTEDQVLRLTTDEQGRKLGGFRLALVHHPLDHLDDYLQCEEVLTRHVDLLMHGYSRGAHLLDASSQGRVFHVLPAAGTLYLLKEPISCQVLDVTLDDAGSPQGYRVWLRSWSRRGHWYDDDSVYRESRTGRYDWWSNLLAPAPKGPVNGRQSYKGLSPAFSVRSLRIQNLKNINRLTLPLAPSSTLPGRWQCIAGVNGTGKSTLLQALVCVLLGDRLAQELGGGRLRGMRRRQADALAETDIYAIVGSDTEEIELFLPLGPEGVDIKRLEAHPGYGAMREFWDWRAHHHLLVSYGAGRNLSESVDASLDKYSPDVRCQLSLFEPFAPVAHADVLTRKGQLPPPVLTALQKLLEVILADSPVQVMPSTEPLQFQVDEALVSASELPDGFRSLVVWLADLCAGWHDKAPQDAASGDISRLRGTVLIDEIDLHLHPRLQRVLVPRLRQLLPGVQWIVSTHSPLVLASFDRNEIIPLEGFSGGVRPLDRQILGFSTDEVYRWLMETEPTSAALDELWKAREQDSKAREELGLLLSQTPEVDAERARRNREWLKQRVEELRQKRANDDEQP